MTPVPPPPPADVEAMRRTSLALERTQLAWWRTGLTALAVGIAVGRVLPELGGGPAGAYAVIGFAFAIYGVVLFAYGSHRERSLAAQMKRGSATIEPPIAGILLGLVGALLGLATAALIVFA